MSNTRTTPPDQTHPDPVVQRLLDWLKNSIAALFARVATIEGYGLQKRTRGTVNVSTTAAVNGSATVTHGLGSTPTAVLVSANNDASVTNCGVSGIGATQFTVGVRFVDGVSRTTSITVAWEAIA